MSSRDNEHPPGQSYGIHHGDFVRRFGTGFEEQAGDVAPVDDAVREGLQAGVLQKALLKNTPRFASRSRFGVLIGLSLLNTVVQSFMSSIAINRTFGLEDLGLAAQYRPTQLNPAAPAHSFF